MFAVARAICDVLRRIPDLAEDDAYARAALREEHWYGELQSFAEPVHIRAAAMDGRMLDTDASDPWALCGAIRTAHRMFRTNLAWVEISRHERGIILADHAAPQREGYSRRSQIIALSVVKCIELHPAIGTATPHLLNTMVRHCL